MANFCEDLEREVIVRLPVKSLVRFQLVSKDWHSQIASPSFIKSQQQSSVLNSVLIIQRCSSTFSLQLGVKKGKGATQVNTSELIPLLHDYFLSSEPLKPLASCDGLVCILSDYKEVHLWNPSINKIREMASLPCRLSNPNNKAPGDYFVSGAGVGFVSSIDDYKIVCIVNCDDDWGVYVNVLRDNKWRKLSSPGACIWLFDTITDRSRSSKIFQAPVLLNEALHWILPLSEDSDTTGLQILKFDLVKERFVVVPSVKNHTPNSTDCYSWCLGVTKANKLCVYQLSRAWKRDYFSDRAISLNVWMLEEYGNWGSWVNVCSLEWKTEFSRKPTLLTPTDGSKILMSDGSKSNFILVDLCRNPPAPVRVGSNCVPTEHTISYVETLVSPFRGAISN